VKDFSLVITTTIVSTIIISISIIASIVIVKTNLGSVIDGATKGSDVVDERDSGEGVYGVALGDTSASEATRPREVGLEYAVADVGSGVVIVPDASSDSSRVASEHAVAEVERGSALRENRSSLATEHETRCRVLHERHLIDLKHRVCAS